ncbi:MAG TPA: hypothetical protein VGE84_05430, partial [Allosphingosinicella sp.]
ALANGHACVQASGGGVICWGSNDRCEAGKLPTPDDYRPTPVAGASAGFEGVTVGCFSPSHTTCAIKASTGTPFCWGSNINGQVGHDKATDTKLDGGGICGATPIAVMAPSGAGALTEITKVSFGDQSACGLTRGGVAYCWGANLYGAFGTIDFNTATPKPQQVPVAAQLVNISGEFTHQCATAADLSAWCWGSNNMGELGRGTAQNAGDAGAPCQYGRICGVPAAIPALKAKDIAAGAEFTVALADDGTVWAWGANDLGQLGHLPRTSRDQDCGSDPSRPCGPTPTRVPALP